MAARSGAGLASVITAVTLAISGASGTTTVISGDGSIAVSSSVAVQVTCEGCPPAADRDLQAQRIIDVLDDMFAGVPGLPGRLALEIPARFGSRLLLMHF